MFKKKEIDITPKHVHKLDNSLGMYYKLFRTTYRNCLDQIVIYERRHCECGYYKDVVISRDEFPPSMYDSDDDEKDFIELAKAKGVEEEFEINIRTKSLSARSNCCY